MPGLVPGIHVFPGCHEQFDLRRAGGCGLPNRLNFAYKLIANEFVFHREDGAISKVRDKTKSAPIERPPIDFDEFWAKLDALGARDFLLGGIPDDPPVEPDPRVFFDE